MMIKLGSRLRDRFGLWVFSWEFLNYFFFCVCWGESSKAFGVTSQKGYLDLAMKLEQ